ncbi:MAG TPA: DUF4430 domain-containing protein [Solirubrobacterales bacterium]|nr:DUF4430 domain-containing protein [Solirubrobacterales bacterium]
MPRRSARALSALTIVLSVWGVVATSAFADPAPQLRVEGTGKTLDPGTRYVTGTESVPAATDAGCRRTKRRHRVPGATALGLLGSAFESNRLLRPLGVADDEFGLRVCRIGSFVETDSPFTGWLYRVNHRSPSNGAALKKVGGGDEVLWYFANFGTGTNTGDELVVRAPARVKPGTLDVSVLAYAFDGSVERAPDGTVVRGGERPATVQGGTAKVQVKAGKAALRAVGGIDIPSAPVDVCVSADLDECPSARGDTIVGTASGDRIVGTRGPDVIRARGGADRVNARGGGSDRVVCGRGRDLALLGAGDVAFGCEVKIRR